MRVRVKASELRDGDMVYRQDPDNGLWFGPALPDKRVRVVRVTSTVTDGQRIGVQLEGGVAINTYVDAPFDVERES